MDKVSVEKSDGQSDKDQQPKRRRQRFQPMLLYKISETISGMFGIPGVPLVSGTVVADDGYHHRYCPGQQIEDQVSQHPYCAECQRGNLPIFFVFDLGMRGIGGQRSWINGNVIDEQLIAADAKKFAELYDVGCIRKGGARFP